MLGGETFAVREARRRNELYKHRVDTARLAELQRNRAKTREEDMKQQLREARRQLRAHKAEIREITRIDDDVLRRLHQLLWRVTKKQHPRDLEIPFPVDGLRLTPQLWYMICSYIASDDGIVVGLGSTFGFTIDLSISRHRDAMFPGATPDPEHLLAIHQDHLPRPLRAADGTFIRGSGRFEDGWRYFSRISHSDMMRERRKRYGLKPPVEKSKLEY